MEYSIDVDRSLANRKNQQQNRKNILKNGLEMLNEKTSMESEPSTSDNNYLKDLLGSLVKDKKKTSLLISSSQSLSEEKVRHEGREIFMSMNLRKPKEDYQKKRGKKGQKLSVKKIINKFSETNKLDNG